MHPKKSRKRCGTRLAMRFTPLSEPESPVMRIRTISSKTSLSGSLRNPASIRRADRLESWVYQTTRNAIADFYRRRRASAGYSGRGGGCLFWKAERGKPQSCRRGVSQTDGGTIAGQARDAVLMYETEELSQAEIAKKRQISLSGAKSRIQRGRRQLEELFRSCCQLELDQRGNVLESQCTTPGCSPSRG